MTQFYIGFFGWIVYVAVCILYNYIKIEKYKVKPRYFVSNTWRAFFGAVALILMTIQDGFDPAYLRTWIPAIPPMIFILSSFYLFFDAGLNGLRNFPWNYKGKDSGWMDSLKMAGYCTVKVVCLIGVIWSVVHFYQS